MRISVKAFCVGSILCAAAVAAGCSPKYYRESADKEVYGILGQKSGTVPGMTKTFTIEQPQKDYLTGLPVAPAPKTPPPPAEWPPAGQPQTEQQLMAPEGAQPPQIPPAAPPEGAAPAPQAAPDAVAPAPAPGTAAPAPGAAAAAPAPGAAAAAPAPGGIVATPSPEGGAKPPITPAEERAVNLAGQTPGPVPQPGEVVPTAEIPLSAEARRALIPPEEDEAGAYIITLDKALEIATLNSRDYQTQKESLYQTALTLTGVRYQFAPHFFGIITGNYDATGLGDEQQVSGSTNIGFNWLLATGATVSTSLTTTVSRFLTGQPREAASSLFNLTITQPLLQGGGIDIVTEPLKQAERNVTYQIRQFVEFRRSFFVNVLSQYYRVLQQRQVLLNQIENYRGQLTTYAWAYWRGQAGRIAQYEVDQNRQAMLNAEVGVVQARAAYQSALDSFKITLALPTEARIVLDPKELQTLEDTGVSNVGLTEGSIMEIALARRLDLLTARDSVDDAKRKIHVAENGLLPVLNLTASLTSTTEPNQPAKFTSDNTNAGIGAELDLPLDRLNQRNTYRNALIAMAQAQRQAGLSRDQVVQDVRNDLRDFNLNRRSYEIQLDAVKLAQRRVDSMTLNLEAGRALMRDVLDARDSLLGAQNSLVQAIVAFKVASVSLSRDMDILTVGDQGQLKEDFDEYK